MYLICWQVIWLESDKENKKTGAINESFMVRITDPMLYDRIHILSNEYSVSVESLVNVAVRRLLEDVDFVRGLRSGNINLK